MYNICVGKPRYVIRGVIYVYNARDNICILYMGHPTHIIRENMHIFEPYTYVIGWAKYASNTWKNKRISYMGQHTNIIMGNMHK